MRRVAAGVGALVAVLALSACPADDGESEAVDAGDGTAAADGDDFCSYMEALDDEDAPGPSSSEWVELYAGAAERAPDQFRDAMAAQLALIEEQQEMRSSGDDERDLTGDMEYMELVAETQTPSFRAALDELPTYLDEECGIELRPPSIDTVAPFTGTILAPEE